MIETLFRVARSAERRIPPTALIVMAGLIFLASVAGVRASSGDSDNKPVAQAPTTTTTVFHRTPIAGFQTAAFTITPADKPPASYCGLLAETDEQLAKGLMGQRDLKGYDGMIFVFKDQSTAAFYMANVPVPLSVAWFDEAGKLVSSADMAVCMVEAAKCPLYNASGPYRSALETLQGGLGSMGVGDGSTISIGDAGSCT